MVSRLQVPPNHYFPGIFHITIRDQLVIVTLWTTHTERACHYHQVGGGRHLNSRGRHPRNGRVRHPSNGRGRRPSNGRERRRSNVGQGRHPSDVGRERHPSKVDRERHPSKVGRRCRLSYVGWGCHAPPPLPPPPPRPLPSAKLVSTDHPVGLPTILEVGTERRCQSDNTSWPHVPIGHTKNTPSPFPPLQAMEDASDFPQRYQLSNQFLNIRRCLQRCSPD